MLFLPCTMVLPRGVTKRWRDRRRDTLGTLVCNWTVHWLTGRTTGQTKTSGQSVHHGIGLITRQWRLSMKVQLSHHLLVRPLPRKQWIQVNWKAVGQTDSQTVKLLTWYAHNCPTDAIHTASRVYRFFWHMHTAGRVRTYRWLYSIHTADNAPGTHQTAPQTLKNYKHLI